MILTIQDTTARNHTGLEATEGLADLVGGGKGSNGILAHARQVPDTRSINERLMRVQRDTVCGRVHFPQHRV